MTLAPLVPCCLACIGRGRGIGRKQQAKHFQRLLENQGSWEAARGQAAAGLVPPPQEGWESLAQHVPELAEVACEACDLASATRYFVGPGSSAAAAEEADSLARLALMLASAAGLGANADVLGEEERQRFGLDANGTAALPPEFASSIASPPQEQQLQQQQQQQQQLGAAVKAEPADWQAAGQQPGQGAIAAQHGAPAGAMVPMQLTAAMPPHLLQQYLLMQQQQQPPQLQPPGMGGGAPTKPYSVPLPAAANGGLH